MAHTDNVVYLRRDTPLIDLEGNIDPNLDGMSREFLLSSANDLETFGVVNLACALALIRDGVLKHEDWNGGGDYFQPFTVVEMTPEYAKCYKSHLQEIEYIPIANKSDPYLRAFSSRSPKDVRFDDMYLMTKKRLRQELKKGDHDRLIYKTPYRPELVEDLMRLP